MEDLVTVKRIQLLHPSIRQEVTEIYKEICDILTGRAICRFSYTLRTFAEQDALYAIGRTETGRIVTNARGGMSYHNYGLACFSDDTEVLTDSGWKFFYELDQTEKVLVFKDGNTYYEKPLAYVSNEYIGEMVSIQTRSVDLLVTPNHKMIVQRKTTAKWDEKWSEILAENVDYKYRIPTAGNFSFTDIIPEYPFSDRIDAETWWEFMGWYISEGTCCGVSDGVKRTHNSRFKVSISQKEGSEEWHIIKDCLDRTGFTYNYIGHEFIIHSKELHSIMFPNGNSYQKRVPRYLLNAPKNLLELLCESLLLGDGTHYEKRQSYWTVNEKLANDVSEIFILLGKSVSINERFPKEVMLPHGELLQTFNYQYAVNNRNSVTHELRNGDDNFKCISREEYSGITYCVTTQAGAIFVKRNGKVSVCGNCDIVLLKDTDGNGTYDTASWETNRDFDGDGKADWIEVVNIFKQWGWEAGADWYFNDYPHFQKSFGISVRELFRRVENKLIIAGTNYPKLSISV